MRGTRLEAIPGAPPSLATAPTGCSFAPRCKLASQACEAAVPSMVGVGAAHVARCIAVAPAAA
jgi:oligopeptide/dipeptide ABC transporter ATP-binding protein